MKFSTEVEIVQRKLESLGYDLPKHGADGLYGPETLAAVNKFRIDNGLEPVKTVDFSNTNHLLNKTKDDKFCDCLEKEGLKLLIQNKEEDKEIDNIWSDIKSLFSSIGELLFSEKNSDTVKEVASSKTKILLDPGHGDDFGYGVDPGAVRKLKDGTEIYEKDIALGVSKHLKHILEEQGFEVSMTRDSDVYAGKGNRFKVRDDAIKQQNHDLFLSIHANALPQEVSYRASGAEVHVSSESSKEFAEYLLADFDSTKIKKNNFHVINNERQNYKPSALFELGFMSNPDELEVMATDAGQKGIRSKTC